MYMTITLSLSCTKSDEKSEKKIQNVILTLLWRHYDVIFARFLGFRGILQEKSHVNPKIYHETP